MFNCYDVNQFKIHNWIIHNRMRSSEQFKIQNSKFKISSRPLRLLPPTGFRASSVWGICVAVPCALQSMFLARNFRGLVSAVPV